MVLLEERGLKKVDMRNKGVYSVSTSEWYEEKRATWFGKDRGWKKVFVLNDYKPIE